MIRQNLFWSSHCISLVPQNSEIGGNNAPFKPIVFAAARAPASIDHRVQFFIPKHGGIEKRGGARRAEDFA
jgi:hypothetical protein